MRIQVLGPGCKRSRALLDRTRQALVDLDRKDRVEEVTDPEEMARLGVLTAPALVVDHQVLVSGRVPSMREVRRLLEEGAAREA